MKSVLQEYLATGLLGGYHPEQAIKQVVDGKVRPVYRDTVYTETDTGMELQREMIVGGRTFVVHSIFSSAAKTTPTQTMLRIIENDLEKK